MIILQVRDGNLEELQAEGRVKDAQIKHLQSQVAAKDGDLRRQLVINPGG